MPRNTETSSELDPEQTRRSRRRRNTANSNTQAHNKAPSIHGNEGGRYAPFVIDDLIKIDNAIRTILETIGLSEAPEIVTEKILEHGGELTDDNRLIIPSSLFNKALGDMQRNFTLYGQKSGLEMRLSGKRVHVGSGGAAPLIVDLDSGRYRSSTLKDLYDAARIVDSQDNIHFFSRSMIATDMPDELALDINTAYASLSGTAKHVFTAITLPEHVEKIAQMCYCIAGSREAFIEKPFMSVNINHVVPPLRFSADACDVMAQAIKFGLPVHANSFGQLGASSPVTIAGSVAQNVAETLAGMIFAWTIDANAKVTFGSRPMITDLRTGALTGGGGEQAMLMAGTTQMAQYYDLPNTCIAGATDSKIADAQSGYEKCLSITLAAQAGANCITQACGVQASLMSCALESYVIDNDMLGGILRSISPVEVSESTLCTDSIEQVVKGDGHFLGQSETLERMQTDFLYPNIADRRTFEAWQEDGSKDIREQAKLETHRLLDTYFPTHISSSIDDELRKQFSINLDKSGMRQQ